MKSSPLCLKSFAILVLLTVAAIAPTAACDLQILSVYPCDASGARYAPRVGDTYINLRFNWRVVGTPNAPFIIRVQLGAADTGSSRVYTANGQGDYGDWAVFACPLDGPIDWHVTIDPGNRSGDTNLANNAAAGVFAPTPPAKAIEYFDTNRLVASQSMMCNWTPNTGTVSKAIQWMGKPTSASFQNVVHAPGPAGAKVILTSPNHEPVFETRWLNFAAQSRTVSQTFVVDVRNVRVNQKLLRKCRWSDLASLPASIAEWLTPDTVIQSDAPDIANFVGSVLPGNYRASTTPYDAARALYQAIVGRTTYGIANGSDDSALGTLQSGYGLCGGFSCLMCACLRSIGIPARTLVGWWIGDNQIHVMAEFYLPGYGWIVNDPSIAKQFDPMGKYAYLFGVHTGLNTFCAVSRGEAHQTAEITGTGIQIGAIWFWGNAAWNGISWETHLTLQ